MGNEQSVHRSRTVPPCDESMSLQLRNNYYPLHFHQVHGDNIRLSKNKTVACRSEGFCNGIVFSDRPIMICEPIYVKFLETSPNWSGALRIGFTMNDPVSLKSKLPRYACPDLTSMHGNWAKAVGEKCAKKDSVLYYYVDQNGDVHYGIGSEEYGIFFGGVNTSGKLWAVLDIYGNTVAIEFMDPSSLNQEYQNDSHATSINYCTKERSKFQPVYTNLLRGLSFHTMHGKNVTLSKNRCIVSKKAGISSLGYAFTEQPIEIGRKIIMSVRQTDHFCEGLLLYGITSCDPKNINPYELPENVDDLFDRSEYWIVKQKPYPFAVGDTITFKINNEGQVEVVTNGELDPFFYVDHTQPLWLFVNLTNSISQLRLEGSNYYEDDLCDACYKANIDSGKTEIGTAGPSGSNYYEHVLCDVCYKANIDSGKAEIGTAGPSGQQSSNECVICYEKQVDCALYRCGHMCMCYNCALKLWDTGSTAQCPICRNYIQDVIKIYK